MILDCDKTNLRCESVTKLGSLPDLHLPAGRPTSGDIKMGAGGIMPEVGALIGPRGLQDHFWEVAQERGQGDGGRGWQPPAPASTGQPQQGPRRRWFPAPTPPHRP